ncbi:MAG: LysR substrate-binding domain-containing protein [Rhodospirillales bacterium]
MNAPKARYLPTLRQFRYLTAMAEHGHFGRAADACAVTQSTLSAGVKELEQALGVTLIERAKRGAMLTPLGEDVVQRARALMRDADDIVDLCQARTGALSGPLKFGVIPTIGPYLLPPVLPQLRKTYPDLTLLLREEQTEPLLRRLEDGALDVVLLAAPYELDGFETAPIADEIFLLACPAGHALAKRKGPVSMSDFDARELLLLEEGHCLSRHAAAACELAGRRGGAGVQATSLYTLIEMVASGLGVTLLPETAAESGLLARTDTVLKRVKDLGGGRTVTLVWRPASPRAEDFKALARTIAKTVKAAKGKRRRA